MVCGSFNEEIILKRYNYSLTHSKGVKKKGKSPFKKDLNNQKSGFFRVPASLSLLSFSLSLFLFSVLSP